MNLPWILAVAIGLVLALAGACAQSPAPDGLVNGGFEDVDESGRPRGWSFSPMLVEAGYRLESRREGALAGARCAVLDATAGRKDADLFGNVMQDVDAAPYRGKRIRFRAAVRAEALADDGQVQLWLRVDRKPQGGGPATGAFDNMADRPIREAVWKHHDIVAQVEPDADRVFVGCFVIGTGRAWLDDATLAVVPDTTPLTAKSGPDASSDGVSQPFLVGWLVLPALGVVLLVLSQLGSGFVKMFSARFAFAYWLLYSLPAPFTSIAPTLFEKVASWYEHVSDRAVRETAARVLAIPGSLVAPNGSGDTTYDYVRLLLCFALALAAAASWSLVDRRRTDGRWQGDLLRSYVRWVLAITLLGYGLAKTSSAYNQFPAPDIDQLLKTYGESSPMNLVWTFMGSSHPYTVIAGLGEVLAALLLIWRTTTTLGALVAAGVMTNVVLLNFCYDVPVKQYSSHLLLMALYLLLPDLPRLASLLVRNRGAPPADLDPPYAGPRATLVHRALKAVLVVMGIGVPLAGGVLAELGGGNQPAPPACFGTYEVEAFTRGGTVSTTDPAGWHTVTLRRYPGPRDVIRVRTVDRTLVAGKLAVDADGRTLHVSGARSLPFTLTIKPVDETHALLSGGAGNLAVEARMRRLRREDFLLVRRGFHWINEYPFNR